MLVAVPVIETMTFRLTDGADLGGFLAADSRVQTEFAYRQPGLLRRTTARSDDGWWIVVDVWDSAEASEACAERWDSDPVAQAFMAFVDRATLAVQRYSTLD